MNYKETIDWLFLQLPMYQQVGAVAYKKDLHNTVLLDNYLHNPHKNIKTIHVAGTNGKGSTSSMIASILQEAGYKVGLYTSPHLKDFRERIKINGQLISEDFVVDFVKQHKLFFEENSLSFFEMTVGLAFDYFEKQKVDVAVIEVGMGGRLDSTNIITPLISVITNIGIDHTQFLGTTLEAIAFEKAGIIKPNIPVVIGEYTSETKPIFEEMSAKNESEIYWASNENVPIYKSDLKGIYQEKNKKTVYGVIKNLQKYFIITEENIKNGFLNTVKNTGLLGRWQIMQENPKIVLDTAHNLHGLKEILKQINLERYNDLHFVLGFVNDKNLDEILPIFPKNAFFYFCKPNILRGLEIDIIIKKATELQLQFTVFNSVSNAFEASKIKASNSDFIYVGGSTFVVAEIV